MKRKTVAVVTVVAGAENKTRAADDVHSAETTPILVHTWQATNNLRNTVRAIGYSIPEQHRYAYIVYSIFLNSIARFFPVGFMLGYWRMMSSYADQLDVGLLLTSLQAFVNLIACESKFLTLMLTRRKWLSAEKFLKRLDRRCGRSPQEVDLQRLCVRHGNRCTTFFVSAYWTYSTALFLSAFVLDRPLYDIYIPFLNWRNSRSQFVLSTVIEYITVNLACLQQSFNDGFAVIYVYILRMHMNILLLRFEHLGNSDISLTDNLDELKQCIRDHTTYLELYDLIAPIISKTTFIQFVTTALILSTTLVNFMLIATDFYSRIGSFFYIIVIIVQILPVCYSAQCLKDDSDRLSNVIFHSNWPDQDATFRKMMVFLMHRSQHTKDLKAGNFFTINLSCCLSIVKFSFTLYTFIKTMGLEEKFGQK